MPPDQRQPATGALNTLAAGEVEIEGRMPWSSNGTFLCRVSLPGSEPLAAIYKPAAAERPLWDFPGGLYRREVAAWELAVQLGWDLVPETIERLDAPLGEGSLQRFVAADFEQHYFTLLEDDAHRAALRRMAAFDVVANNADRKGGHCLLDADGHVWGIDHGLCFHEQPKLRTVIWDFAGEELDPGLLDDLERLERDGPGPPLRRLLTETEVIALRRRLRRLVRDRVLPAPRSDRPYPWPLV